MRVLCGTILMMMALGAAGAGWTPGSEYAGGSSVRTNSVYDPFLGNLLPQNQNVSIVGRINTNDVAIFTDRSGRFVRGTNLIGQVQGWAQEATTGAVSLATLAYTTGTNAQATADVAYGWGNHALAGYLLAPAVSNIANYAAATQIAAIPAPTGVPIWYDSSDSNYFATCSGGTGYVWKVTLAATGHQVIMSGNFDFSGLRPPVYTNTFTFPTTNNFISAWDGGGYTASITYNGAGISWGTHETTFPMTLIPAQSAAHGTAVVSVVYGPATTTNFYTRLASTNDLSRYATLDAYVAGTNLLHDEMIAISNNAANALSGRATFSEATNIADNAVASAKIKRLYEEPGTNYVAVTGSNLVLYASSGTEYFKLTFTGVYNALLVGQPWTSPYTVSSDGNTSNNWSISINKLPGYAGYSYVRSVQGDDWWRNTTYPSDFPLTMTSSDGGYGSILIERVLATASKIFASLEDLTTLSNNLSSASSGGASSALVPIVNVATGAVTTVNVSTTNLIYYIEAAGQTTITNILPALNCTSNLSYEIWYNATTTNALTPAWDTRMQFAGGAPEMTCTGLVKIACQSACGTVIQARQSFPTRYQWSWCPYVAGGTLAVNAQADGANAPATTTRYFRNPFCGVPLTIIKTKIWYTNNLTTNTLIFGTSHRSDQILSVQSSITNVVAGSATYEYQKTFAAVWTTASSSSESMFYVSAISTSGTTGRMYLSQQLARPADENETAYFAAGGRDFR